MNDKCLKNKSSIKVKKTKGVVVHGFTIKCVYYIFDNTIKIVIKMFVFHIW